MLKYATRNACQFFIKYAYITRVVTMFPLQSQTQYCYSSLLLYCTAFLQNFRFLALCPPEILTPKYHEKLKNLIFKVPPNAKKTSLTYHFYIFIIYKCVSITTKNFRPETSTLPMVPVP